MFLQAVDAGPVFFCCSSCGCAWDKPPEPHVVDTVDPPAKFAPAGFRYARLADIKAAGLERLIAGEGKPDTWDFSGDPGFWSAARDAAQPGIAAGGLRPPLNSTIVSQTG